MINYLHKTFPKAQDTESAADIRDWDEDSEQSTPKCDSASDLESDRDSEQLSESGSMAEEDAPEGLQDDETDLHETEITHMDTKAPIVDMSERGSGIPDVSHSAEALIEVGGLAGESTEGRVNDTPSTAQLQPKSAVPTVGGNVALARVERARYRLFDVHSLLLIALGGLIGALIVSLIQRVSIRSGQQTTE